MNMTVTPYLCADGASDAIAFYKKAFGAEETYRLEEDGRIGHAELRIGETTIYLSDEYEPYRVLSPRTLNGNSVSLSISAPDADAVFERALAAGVVVIVVVLPEHRVAHAERRLGPRELLGRFRER
jgi:PhnB protein